jgi:formylglycine-generating enzyme required for sulfatase activity
VNAILEVLEFNNYWAEPVSKESTSFGQFKVNIPIMYQSIRKSLIALSVLIGGGANLSEAQPPKEITNSIGMKLVLIPKGTFTMGSPESEILRREDEVQHEVTISKDYCLGVYEVTQGQYQKVMGTNPSYFQSRKGYDSVVIPNSDSSMYPVEHVSWDDAVEFCERLSELPEERNAGRVYRLPTEAEWEYACRAGSTTAFSFGEDSKSLGDHAWFMRNGNGQVGKKKPNAWGLYDMHGSMWEWCSDRYAEYPKSAVSDPAGPSKGSFHVRRGGSFANDASICRSARRLGRNPRNFNDFIGFRVALSPSGISGSPEAVK